MRCVRFSFLFTLGLLFVGHASFALAGEEPGKPVHCGTPAPTEPVYCGTNPQPTPPIVPVVRDHRQPVSTVVIRDHRKPVQGVVVRDHRKPPFVTANPVRPTVYGVPSYNVPQTSHASGGVVVTSSGSGPIIRDHRTPKPKPKGPIVRPSGNSSWGLPLPKLPIKIRLPF